MLIKGILLLYHHLLWADAPTILEHVDAFEKHSRFKVWKINTELGFPDGLNELEFQIIVLHYSLWFPNNYNLNNEFLSYLKRFKNSYKIAIYQDEYHYCKQRFDFIKRYKVDCIYSLMEPDQFEKVYKRYTEVDKIIYSIPGYVSDDLIELGDKLTMTDEQRTIDVGYRGRPLPFYMGKGAQEKTEIGIGFKDRCAPLNLTTDIETEEHKRIYGKSWYKFLANCRAVLGVEAGVSIFDTQDLVRKEYERSLALNPKISFRELSDKLLCKWENNIFYRTISPRHFEAAALRVCQILFEGTYSGILQPMVHYIPLKKDFSNFDEVIDRFQDKSLRQELTENAHRDLIASRRYSYQKFIDSFDRELEKNGFRPDIPLSDCREVSLQLDKDLRYRKAKAIMRIVRSYPFPGRRFIVPILKTILGKGRNAQVAFRN